MKKKSQVFVYNLGLKSFSTSVALISFLHKVFRDRSVLIASCKCNPFKMSFQKLFFRINISLFIACLRDMCKHSTFEITNKSFRNLLKADTKFTAHIIKENFFLFIKTLFINSPVFAS